MQEFMGLLKRICQAGPLRCPKDPPLPTICRTHGRPFLCALLCRPLYQVPHVVFLAHASDEERWGGFALSLDVQPWNREDEKRDAVKLTPLSHSNHVLIKKGCTSS